MIFPCLSLIFPGFSLVFSGGTRLRLPATASLAERALPGRGGSLPLQCPRPLSHAPTLHPEFLRRTESLCHRPIAARAIHRGAGWLGECPAHAVQGARRATGARDVGMSPSKPPVRSESRWPRACWKRVDGGGGRPEWGSPSGAGPRRRAIVDESLRASQPPPPAGLGNAHEARPKLAPRWRGRRHPPARASRAADSEANPTDSAPGLPAAPPAFPAASPPSH